MIYFPERKLASKGGPAGYLYNLNDGLKKVESGDLEITLYSSAPIELEENQFLRNRVPKRLKEIRRAYKYANYLKKSIPVDESLLVYDAIHFHSTEDLYLNRKLLERYVGKVILTSHTPCVPYQEIIGRLNPEDYIFFKKKIDSLVEIDRYAFERADYIIFPCEEAEEPYYNTWPQYARIRNAEKYRYLPTGIMGCTVRETRTEYRKKYNIPENAFVISYVGRHNEIKGYGILKEIGKELFSDEDIYFLIAGREGPLYKLDEERWIEVGWTTDPHSLIAASDVFVLPNKETYFDLILLEVLSLGIPVVMSATGGNKYFEKFGVDGLYLYNSCEEACQELRQLRKMDKEERRELGQSLVELFNEQFTVKKFAENYVKILEKIVK